MPIIDIKFIDAVVATRAQKLELVRKMTDTFVEVLGDVVRPFTYVVIEEIDQGEWGIGGVPMPDVAYLVGPDRAKIVEKSNELMRGWLEQGLAPPAPTADDGQ